MGDLSNSTSVINSTMSSIAVEATTLLNNLTTAVHSEILKIESTTFPPDDLNRTTELLGTPLIPEGDDTHRNPELKYFSTVIIIFMGLTILIVPVFCFVGVLCARARVFRTVREVAGRGWGFTDADVPYAEFGSEDYPKDKDESRNTSGDVRILVAGDNHVPSSRPPPRPTSFLGFHNPPTDEDDDISSLPPTFVHASA